MAARDRRNEDGPNAGKVVVFEGVGEGSGTIVTVMMEVGEKVGFETVTNRCGRACLYLWNYWEPGREPGRLCHVCPVEGNHVRRVDDNPAERQDMQMQPTRKEARTVRFRLGGRVP